MAKDIKGLEYNKCLVFQEQIDGRSQLCKQCRAALMLHYNYRDGKIGEFESKNKKYGDR
jgi:hypothetical protein